MPVASSSLSICFDPRWGAPVLVVHFLAMLELAREHLLEMTQVEAFAPIYVRLADGRVEAKLEHGLPSD
jgi:segregation and condensation protein A